MHRSVRTGCTAFEQIFGVPLFEYLGERPSQRAVFNQAMAESSRAAASAVVEACELTGRRLVVDVGGGSGSLLAATLRAIRSCAASSSIALAACPRPTRCLRTPGCSIAASWSYLATNDGLVVIRDAAGAAPGEPEVLFEPGLLGWAGNVAGDAETLLVSAYPFPWLYRSDDGGASFVQVVQTTGISFLALRLVGDDVYALQPNNLWVGHDRGQDWQQWGGPVPDAVEFDIGRWPQPHPSVADQVYVASSGAGVYAAGEPGQFTRTGIPAAEVFALAVANVGGGGGDALVAGTFRSTFRTELPDREAVHPEDFEWVFSGFEGFTSVAAEFVASAPADPAVVYKVQRDPVGTFSIYRSLDGGGSWQRRTSPSEIPTSLLVHPADPDRIYVGYWSLTGAGLVTSTDGGDTWRKVDHGRALEALAGDPDDPVAHLVAPLVPGQRDRIRAGDRDGLYLSTDGGLSFARTAGGHVTAIAVDPDDPERLVLGGRALYTSDDGGSTLRPASHVALDMWIGEILFVPDGSGRVYAASRTFFDDLGVVKNGRGVLMSPDGGASWAPFNQGLDNRNVTSLAIAPEGRHLYAGTLGGSVHRIRLAGIGPVR